MRKKIQKGRKLLKVLYSTHIKKEGPLKQAGYMQTPRISMEGKWLEELGFHIGDSLEVEYGDGYIHIHFPAGMAGRAALCEPSGEYPAPAGGEGCAQAHPGRKGA